MDEAEVLRQWLVFAALVPYASHCDHRAERAEYERRMSRRRAALLARIPVPRPKPVQRPARQLAPRGTGPWHG